jgi:hypothetical protein
MPRDSIQLQLDGGCGNQLFQFAAGLYIANKNHKFLFADTSRISGNRHNGFCISESSYLKSFNQAKFGNLNQQTERNSTPFLKKITWRKYLSKEIGFDEKLQRKTRIKVLQGYFQSFRYVEELEKCGILDLGKLSLSFSEHLQPNLLDKTISDEDLIIHIRGGDLNHYRSTIGKLSLEYFQQIIDSAQFKNVKKIIISDEPILNLQKKIMGDKLEFIETSSAHPLGLIYFISRFKNIAISNSTLSWWGAKLSSQNSNILVPNPWFKNLPQPLYLIPSPWKLKYSIWEDHSIPSNQGTEQ